jgi:hypothetical protein
MIDAATDIVCDAGPRIHLDETSCLDLLRDFRKIILPSFVVDEIEKHPPPCPDSNTAIQSKEGRISTFKRNDPISSERNLSNLSSPISSCRTLAKTMLTTVQVEIFR